MRRALSVVAVILLLLSVPLGASAAIFTFNQSQLSQLWEVYENPNNILSFLINSPTDTVPGNNPGPLMGGYEFVGLLYSSPGNPYAPFAQMQIGANFWGYSGNTGISGATVADIGASDLTAYDTYRLSFLNTNNSAWMVNLYLNTGWTDAPYSEPNNYYEATWKTLLPGQSTTLSINLNGVANLNHVTNIGFNVGGNLDSIGKNPSNPDVFHIAVTEPGTLILFGTGLIGLAAWRRRAGV